MIFKVVAMLNQLFAKFLLTDSSFFIACSKVVKIIFKVVA